MTKDSTTIREYGDTSASMMLILLFLGLVMSSLGNDDFFKAARTGNLSVLEQMLKSGIDVHLRDSKGNTALVIASGRGQVDVMAMLLSVGASVEDATVGGLFDGKSCLMWASSQGRVEAVRVLIQAGAQVNRMINKAVFQGKTAIQWASSQGHANVVLVLFAAGADVDSAAASGNFQGKTALSWACSQGRLEAARTLLDAGANVHAADGEGVTPLMWAAGSEGSSSEHQKGMMQAANRGQILAQVARLLIRHGANIDARDNDGITALMFASYHGHGDVVRVLLRAGADSTFRNKAGQTAFHLAVGAMQMDTAEYIRQGPDVFSLSLEELRHVPASGWLAALLREANGPGRLAVKISVRQLQEGLARQGMDVSMDQIMEMALATSAREVAEHLDLPSFGSSALATAKLQRLLAIHKASLEATVCTEKRDAVTTGLTNE